MTPDRGLGALANADECMLCYVGVVDAECP